jgi:hypothetical protein
MRAYMNYESTGTDVEQSGTECFKIPSQHSHHIGLTAHCGNIYYQTRSGYKNKLTGYIVFVAYLTTLSQ